MMVTEEFTLPLGNGQVLFKLNVLRVDKSKSKSKCMLNV